MFESKYSKLLTGLLILGIIVIIGVIVFLGWQIINSNNINKDAEGAVDQFQGKVKNQIEDNQQKNDEEVTNEVAPIMGIENIIIDGSASGDTTQTYKGFPMVGTIEIPAINLKYPVLESGTAAAIEVAVGIYDGVGLNKVGNTTIVGHNYRNGTFFSNNKKLVEGDKIYITDTTATKVEYTIYKTYITAPEDSSYLDRDTQGKREISLLTCTDDSQSRLVIWAKES